MQSTYKHLFFDLDHTLWDFERNCEEALWEMFIEFGLKNNTAFTFEHFLTTYRTINLGYWKKYREDKVTKAQLRIGRFHDTLASYSINDSLLSKNMADTFVMICPRKTHLFPYTHEMLSYLQKNYVLHVITNGFKESQYTKMEASGIKQFFSTIITSEEVQSKKPDLRIFQYSLEKTGASQPESLMIGDNLEADIIGAKNAGIDQIYFNPGKILHKEKVTFEIKCLSEIKNYL